MNPFRPTPKATYRINAAGLAPVIPELPHGSGTQVRVRNRGTVDAYVEWGGADVVATIPGAGVAGSLGIAAGGVEVFTLQQNERRISVAVESGTPALEVTIGAGE